MFYLICQHCVCVCVCVCVCSCVHVHACFCSYVLKTWSLSSKMYRYGVHLTANQIKWDFEQSFVCLYQLSGFFFFFPCHLNFCCASLYDEGLYFLGLLLGGNSLRGLFRQHPPHSLVGKPLVSDWFESLLIHISLVAR